jgi:hypothetical protein
MRRIHFTLLSALAAWLPCACDPGPLALGTDTRSIIGGTPVPEGALPAVGALVLQQFTDKQAFCTATLISDRLLVTAAHCIRSWESLSSGAPYLKLGFFNGSLLADSSPLLAIAGSDVHPAYQGGEPPAFLGEYNDIAVARLAQPVKVPPLRLIRPGEAKAIKAGASVLMAGYGLTNPSLKSSAGTKRQGTTTIGETGPAELWILGDGQPQKCSGDSGGPTILEVEGENGKEQRLIGVASRAGENCTGGSVETRIDHYLEWIHGLGTLPCGSGLSPDCPALPPPKAFGEPCTSPEECADRLCLLSGGVRLCSRPCLVEAHDCPRGTECVADGGGIGQPACLAPPPAKKKPGEACSGGEECQSSVCLNRDGGPACATPCDAAGPPCAGGEACLQAPGGARFCAPAAATPSAPGQGGCAAGGDPAPTGWTRRLLPSILIGLLALIRRRPPSGQGRRAGRSSLARP